MTAYETLIELINRKIWYKPIMPLDGDYLYFATKLDRYGRTEWRGYILKSEIDYAENNMGTDFGD